MMDSRLRLGDKCQVVIEKRVSRTSEGDNASELVSNKIF